MNKQKLRRKRNHVGKRNATNIRTYQNVQKRRKRYCKSHDMTMDQLERKLGIKRWTSTPKASSH